MWLLYCSYQFVMLSSSNVDIALSRNGYEYGGWYGFEPSNLCTFYSNMRTVAPTYTPNVDRDKPIIALKRRQSSTWMTKEFWLCVVNEDYGDEQRGRMRVIDCVSRPPLFCHGDMNTKGVWLISWKRRVASGCCPSESDQRPAHCASKGSLNVERWYDQVGYDEKQTPIRGRANFRTFDMFPAPLHI